MPSKYISFNDLACFIYSSEPYVIIDNYEMHMNCTCMKAI